MANKRFKILDGALDYLAYGKEATDITLPAGTPLRKFQEVRNNERKVEYDTTNWKTSGGFNEGRVNPFGLAFDAANLAVVPISKKVAENSSVSAAFVDGGLGVDTAIPGNRLEGYTPAKCTIITPDASKNDPTATSQLTGIKYNKVGKQSYTFPYGRKSATSIEADIRAAIKDKLKTNTTWKFQFTSEKL